MLHSHGDGQAKHDEYEKIKPGKCVGLFLNKDVFAHGQVYVGMSRCGDPDKLFVYGNLDANGERWVAHPV